MLDAIEFVKKDGGVLTLPIYDYTKFQIKEVQGLDPVRASVVMSSYSQIDGQQYQASKRDIRNIVIKIGIVEYDNNTIQENRKELYSYLLPKSEVKIRLVQNDLETLIIDGMIESFEAPMFVKEPEATISILCFDPDFYSDTTNVLEDAPSENKYKTVLTTSTTNATFNYEGDIDTGFIFTLTATSALDNLKLVSTLSDNTFKYLELLDLNLVSGDKIEVSTNVGNKYVRKTHLGVTSSVLYSLTRSSEWLKIYPGLNTIRVVSDVVGTNYSITYVDKYGGL